MSRSKLNRISLAGLAAGGAMLALGSLGAAQARAGQCNPNPGQSVDRTFHLGWFNSCDATTTLYEYDIAPFTGSSILHVGAQPGGNRDAILANSGSGDAILAQSSYGRAIEGYAPNLGVYGEASASNTSSYGLFGRAPSQASGVRGVGGNGGWFSSVDSNGTGVVGTVTGAGHGVRGEAGTGAGVGVRGTGGTGGWFSSIESNGTGVLGSATGAGHGVRGVAGDGGVGVYGKNPSSATNSYGVYGLLSSTTPGFAAAGVWGSSLSTGDAGGGTVGEHRAATGSSAGVFGQTYSTSDGAVGTYGLVIPTNAGADSVGVRGKNAATNGNGYGVWGSQAGSGTGVLGQSSTGIGVLGYSDFVGLLGYAPAGGYAGYFAGDAVVSGTLYKGAGAFRIDHPLDPAHKYLQHSFVESPEMMNVYNGNVTTDGKGFATVKLPAYFQALNRSFRYQLTTIGTRGWDAKAGVWKEIAANKFTIRTNKPDVKVSWQVTGIRHDPYANAHRIPVVVQKPATEQRRYLHPELYGKPASASVVPKVAMRTVAQARR